MRAYELATKHFPSLTSKWSLTEFDWDARSSGRISLVAKQAYSARAVVDKVQPCLFSSSAFCLLWSCPVNAVVGWRWHRHLVHVQSSRETSTKSATLWHSAASSSSCCLSSLMLCRCGIELHTNWRCQAGERAEKVLRNEKKQRFFTLELEGKAAFFGGASCAYSHGNYGQLDDIGTRVTLTANRAWPTSKTAGFHAFCAVGGSVQLLLRFRLLFLFCFFTPKGKDSWAWPPPSLQHCFLFAWGFWCWSCWTRLLSTPEEYFLCQRLENLHLVIHGWADLFRLLLAQFSSVPSYHHVALLHMTACWEISCFYCKTKKKVCGLHCCILQLSFFLCFVLLMLVFFFETVDNNRK